jgi:hypothetical protein
MRQRTDHCQHFNLLNHLYGSVVLNRIIATIWDKYLKEYAKNIWWGSAPQTKSQVEIDLVARDGDSYLFAECKWRNEHTDLPVLQGLVQKAALFGTKKNKVYYALFSKSGFTKSILEEAERRSDVLLFTVKDLFL